MCVFKALGSPEYSYMHTMIRLLQYVKVRSDLTLKCIQRSIPV